MNTTADTCETPEIKDQRKPKEQSPISERDMRRLSRDHAAREARLRDSVSSPAGQDRRIVHSVSVKKKPDDSNLGRGML